MSTGLTVYSDLLFQPEFSLCFIFLSVLSSIGSVFIILFVFIIFFKVCLTLNSDDALLVEWEKKMRNEPSLNFLKRLQYSERLGDLKNVKQLSSPLSGIPEFLDLF